MLKAHIDAVEAKLLVTSRIPANAGHPLHKGTPREAFIRQFLQDHLSERVATGTGEIIDCQSTPNPPSTSQRNQFDVVVYKRDYPKLDLGGGVCAFLAESVVATIEVKSVLDKRELESAIKAARAAKDLQRNVVTSFSAGHQPPAVLNCVVAYDGPARMDTVYRWIGPIHASLGVATPSLPPTSVARESIPSPSIDGIFVLGKGFIVFDNQPVGFITDTHRNEAPNACWLIADTAAGGLLLLFLQLTTAVSGVSGSWLNPFPYLSTFSVPGFRFQP